MQRFLLPSLYCCFIICTSLSSAQSLLVYGVDASSYPTVKAKIYAFNAAGQQVSLSPADLRLSENALPRTILSVSCPPQQPPKQLSSVLVMDVSGSMASGINGTETRLDLAKAAAKAWVKGLPLGSSECAITSFDHANYFNRDFTTDPNQLLSSISTLMPQGGTDYDQGFLQSPAGGLVVSKNGKYKKVIVFLTDGLPNLPPNSAQIISEAKNQNCVVYCVTLGMVCPKELRDISNQTGGNWYENVTTVTQAENIYKQILLQAQYDTPCDITWQSSPNCHSDDWLVQLNWQAQTASTTYSPPAKAISSLDFTPSYMFISSKPVGIPFDTTLRVKAINSTFSISNIISSNPAFDISPKSFSLNAGQSQTLTLRFTPQDSGYTWTTFDFQTDVCTQHYNASGGFPGVKPKTTVLKLTHPNGGEVFSVGMDTIITWSGIPEEDSVRIDFSADNGNIWNPVVATAAGGRYAWSVPDKPSQQCLVRVTQLSAQATGWAKASLNGQIEQPNEVVVDNLGNVYVFGEFSGSARFGNITLTNKSQQVDLYLAKYRPDGSVEWAQRAGGNVQNAAGGITVDKNGNIYIAGGFYGTATFGSKTLNSVQNYDGFYAKYQPDGTCVWARSWGSGSDNEVATKIRVDNADNIYVSGYGQDVMKFGNTTFTCAGDFDVIVAKFKQDGTALWAVHGGGENQDHPLDMAIDKSGNAYVTGYYNGPRMDNTTTSNTTADFGGQKISSPSGAGAVFVWKVNTNGTIAWVKSGNGSDRDALGTAIGVDSKGNVYVAGYYISSDFDMNGTSVSNSEPGEIDIFFGKLRPNGSTEWLQTAGAPATAGPGSGADAALGIAIDSSDNPYMTGWYADGAVFNGIKLTAVAGSDIFVAKYQASGGLSWIETAGGDRAEQGKSMAIDKYGSVYVHGYYASSSLTLGKDDLNNSTFLPAVYTWVINPRELQSDVSDKLFSIVAPQPAAQDVDLGQVIVGKIKDQVFQTFIYNTGDAPFRIDSIGIAGTNRRLFSIVSGIPPFTVPAKGSYPVEFRFKPTAVGVRTANLLIFTQKDTLTKTIKGEGIPPAVLQVLNNLIDFGVVNLGSSRDTIQAVTVKNIGTTAINIFNTRYAGPNDKDFSTIAGGGNFTLNAGDTARLDLRFTPSTDGRTSGQLLFEYSGTGSPAIVDLLGQGLPPLSVQAVNNAIDFGKVQLSTPKDSLQAITIRNSGKTDIQCTGITLSGVNQSDFSIQSSTAAFLLKAGDTVRVDLRFMPQAVGTRNATLEFPYTGGTTPALVQLSGEGINSNPSINIQAVNTSIDFGKVELNTPKDSVQAVTIRNAGTQDIQITGFTLGGSNPGDFSLQSSTAAFVLKAGDTARVDIRFTPQAAGQRTATVDYTYQGGTAAISVGLQGEGIINNNGSSATITVDTVLATPGAIVEIPIRIAKAINIATSGATSFKARLRFNATLLEPIGSTPQGSIQSGERIIELDLPTVADSRGILQNLQFRVGLGNDSATTLRLDTVYAASGVASLTKLDGQFRLYGLCYQGGTRLMNPNSGSLQLLLQSANPFTGTTAYTQVTTAERGRTSLVLYDNNGNMIHSFMEQEMSPGTILFPLDMSTIAAGSYYLRLQSPTQQCTLRMEVLR